jgi:putative hydrolase of the HAD superfamily
MIRAVVFDLWNTLVRSQHGDPYQHLQALLGPGHEAEFASFKREAMVVAHPDARTLLSGWQARLGLTAVQVQAMTEVFRKATEEAECFPEALAALLGTRQRARLALLSNTQNFDMAFLTRLGLAALTPNRFLSSELGFMKPEPQPFAAVQAQLGLFPGEIAMVGDSWRDDVKGALDAGWTAIWVNRAGRPRPEELDPEALLVEVPDLAPIPAIIGNLQAGARCSTCLG